MQTIAVAALSARAMAEAAASEGYEVIALDLFGDVDTRSAASRWLPIGKAGSLQIEPASMVAALRLLVSEGRPLLGWIAGSGFEGEPGLLEACAAVLPLIGTAPAAVRRLRDPAEFFGFLSAQALPFPQVRLQLPEDPAGWLLKDAHACGGWHVRDAPWADDEPLLAHQYVQRAMPGQPMSATFIANGHDVEVLGFNLQSVRAVGSRRFVFCGVIGPVPVPHEIERRVTRIAQALVRHFGIRGLCSLDFMRDGDAIGVLEVNARPPASMSLYGAPAGSPGVVDAHVRACLYGELPAPHPHASARSQMQRRAQAGEAQERLVEGLEIVFARQPLQLDAEAARRIAAWPGIRDVPGAGQQFEAGDPLCTLTAAGGHPEQVRERLNDSRERLLQSLETTA